jgi:hypothetical protein
MGVLNVCGIATARADHLRRAKRLRLWCSGYTDPRQHLKRRWR